MRKHIYGGLGNAEESIEINDVYLKTDYITFVYWNKKEGVDKVTKKFTITNGEKYSLEGKTYSATVNISINAGSFLSKSLKLTLTNDQDTKDTINFRKTVEGNSYNLISDDNLAKKILNELNPVENIYSFIIKELKKAELQPQPTHSSTKQKIEQIISIQKDGKMSFINFFNPLVKFKLANRELNIDEIEVGRKYDLIWNKDPNNHFSCLGCEVKEIEESKVVSGGKRRTKKQKQRPETLVANV